MESLFVLSLDPSINCTGVAVVRKTEDTNDVLFGRAVSAGTDYDQKHMGRMDKTVQLFDVLEKVNERFPLDVVTSEAPTGSMRASGAASLGIIRGFVQSYVLCKRLPICWVHESKVKIETTGNRSADKTPVMEAVEEKFRVPKVDEPKEGALFSGVKYRDQAMSDALAVFYACNEAVDLRELSTSEKRFVKA